MNFKKHLEGIKNDQLTFGRISVFFSVLAEYLSTKPPSSSLMNNGVSFDNLVIPGGVQVVEISEFLHFKCQIF